MSTRVWLFSGCVVFAALSPMPVSANLVYTAVPPCRVIDTRVPNQPMVPGVPRTFVFAGTTLAHDYTSQGGARRVAASLPRRREPP
jgi:hypothetical protein